jgi:hypothetical protein
MIKRAFKKTLIDPDFQAQAKEKMWKKCVSDLPYWPNYTDVSANGISVMRKRVSGFR